MAAASVAGQAYSQSKALFPNLDHAQVETKKAAFQEFGLLYVVPRSDTISLTPLGKQILTLCPDPVEAQKNRDAVILALTNGLCKYQFDNPLPVGGKKGSARAASSDVLPYLAMSYLISRLNFLTASEFAGAVFGLQSMSGLRDLEGTILSHRASGTPFPPLQSLPTNPRTAENLKIYLVSHASLDNEVIRSSQAKVYGFLEQVFELTEYGADMLNAVLSLRWKGWTEPGTVVPVATAYASINDYFENGIGATIPATLAIKERIRRALMDKRRAAGILDIDDLANLKDLPKREFEEGRRRLVKHARLEKVRNPALVLQAKRLFKSIHGTLTCQVCDFNFEAAYGDRGRDYIEGHHTIPISKIEQVTNLTVDDIAMVCSNCHRMLHRPPWISVEELRTAINAKNQMAAV
ncbi:MAG: HNH endonuclease [Chloroflexi bacterium]|nr:HNH endonuclease [Chloroflexota bacterium]